MATISTLTARKVRDLQAQAAALSAQAQEYLAAGHDVAADSYFKQSDRVTLRAWQIENGLVDF